jgi:hypothetical protein
LKGSLGAIMGGDGLVGFAIADTQLDEEAKKALGDSAGEERGVLP